MEFKRRSEKGVKKEIRKVISEPVTREEKDGQRSMKAREQRAWTALIILFEESSDILWRYFWHQNFNMHFHMAYPPKSCSVSKYTLLPCL